MSLTRALALETGPESFFADSLSAGNPALRFEDFVDQGLRLLTAFDPGIALVDFAQNLPGDFDDFGFSLAGHVGGVEVAADVVDEIGHIRLIVIGRKGNLSGGGR